MEITIDDVADYIIVKLSVAETPVSFLKLQKLVYYVQAWHLALKDQPMFNGKFQAWVHGPVSRKLYDRFSGKHMMYDLLDEGDLQQGFEIESLPLAVRMHVDEILEAYAGFSGSQLEVMTHSEEPWIKARGTLKASQRCENEIDEGIMASYYRKMAEG